uniref:Uncharacterized protein n=1 Tax=Alexandrium monilatum TaxID=311494 RepID=A0A7S4W0L1_9DINO
MESNVRCDFEHTAEITAVEDQARLGYECEAVEAAAVWHVDTESACENASRTAARDGHCAVVMRTAGSSQPAVDGTDAAMANSEYALNRAVVDFRPARHIGHKFCETEAAIQIMGLHDPTDVDELTALHMVICEFLRYAVMVGYLETVADDEEDCYALHRLRARWR